MVEGDLGKLIYEIVADDLTPVGTAAAEKNFKNMSIAVGLALAGVGGAIDTLAGKYDGLKAKLDRASDTSGIASDDLYDISIASSSAKDSVEEVSAVMDKLSRAGVTNKDRMEADTDAIMTLADANDSSSDTLFDKLIPAFQEYGLSVDDVGSKSDLLTGITHNTQYSIADVGNILDKTGEKAGSAGLTFDDTATIIETMGRKGVPASQAIKLINGAADDATKSAGALGEETQKLNERQDELKATMTDERDKLAALAIQHPKNAAAQIEHGQAVDKLNKSLKDQEEEFKNNQDKLGDLHNATNNAAASTKTFYEKLGLTDDELKNSKTDFDRAQGSTDRLAKTVDDSATPVDNLKHSFEVLSIQLGKEIAPFQGVGNAMLAVGSAMTALNAAIEINETLCVTDTIAIYAGNAAIWAYSYGCDAATAAQGLLNAAMEANPIGIVVLAIIGLVIAIWYLYNNCKEVHDLIDGILALEIWAWKGCFTYLTAYINAFVGLLHGDFAGANREVVNATLQVWASFPEGLRGMANQVIDVLNGLVNAYNSLSIDIPGYGHIGGGLHTIPKYALTGDQGSGSSVDLTPSQLVKLGVNPHMRARGGPVINGEPYIVGESGPELFVPSDNGNIIPNSTGGIITINLQPATIYLDSTKIGQSLAHSVRLAVGRRIT